MPPIALPNARRPAPASHRGALVRALVFIAFSAGLAAPMALGGRDADDGARLRGYPRLDLSAQASPFGAAAPLGRAAFAAPAKACSADL
ncbi:hypothetical protein [Methylocella sp.]|uniref:hypothetical protein n=1 Tax=Methylocella sp. TaxID=1978226 RepID=UPI0035B03152